jgi:hypothetical protein
MLAVLDKIPCAFNQSTRLNAAPQAPELHEARSLWNELLRSYESGTTLLAAIITYEIKSRTGFTPLSGELLTNRCIMTQGLLSPRSQARSEELVLANNLKNCLTGQ